MSEEVKRLKSLLEKNGISYHKNGKQQCIHNMCDVIGFSECY